MKKITILLICFSFILFGCKKNKSTVQSALIDTRWDLFFKLNPVFSFYAQSQLYFMQNNICHNYRSADTITGSWTVNEHIITVNFEDGAKYIGNIITADSISGTLTVASSNGVWYAKKR